MTAPAIITPRDTDWGKYIGIPFEWHGRSFDGVDCYGLVDLVFRTEFGIDLPDYAYGEEPNLTPMFAAGLAERCWEKVAHGKPRDVVVLTIAGHPLHCGVVIDATRFLHARQGINTCIERLDGGAWRNRIYGFYRYAG